MIHGHKTASVFITAFIIVAVVFAAYPVGSSLMAFIRNEEPPKPAVVSGREVIYSYIDKGEIRIADQILDDQYEVSRFEPVEIEPIVWEEDPYDDIYWRFNFYNLEPVRHLVFAYEITGNIDYRRKLIEIVESFIDSGMQGPHLWDLHGAAFRTMTLVNVWEKLNRKGVLPAELNAKMQEALKVHGDFLADPAHFEEDYNHGLDQSAALYLLAVNFPNLEGADGWYTLAEDRINRLITGIITEDGILVENSPYYHFYVLEKLWEINEYTHTYDLEEFAGLEETLESMIAYAAYIVQPDGSIPTIGASLHRSINPSGVYAKMGAEHPELLYVLTKGAQGKKPREQNVHYPINGQTIMRSGWGKGEEFVNQTQVIFDVGSFRTNHSDLDALSFNLYSRGLALMPDAGLYAYDGPYRAYFHGTRAHNTVVVDGKDQAAGELLVGSIEKVYPGFFEEGNGYVYQSGEHELYRDVSHKRAIALIEDSTMLVIDTLESPSSHTYEQMFHLAPGAEFATNGLELSASWPTGQTLTISQLIPEGVELSIAIDETEPLDGLCSPDYRVAEPCHSISYLQEGENVKYVTLINIGDKKADVSLDEVGSAVRVETEDGVYTVAIGETKGSERSIEVQKNFNVSQLYSVLRPIEGLNAFSEWFSVNESSLGSSSVNTAENSLMISVPAGGSYFEVANDTALNLVNQALYFRVKVDKAENLDDFVIALSNNQWEKTAEYNLRRGAFGVDHIHRDNQWFRFGLREGDLRGAEFGNWEKSDPAFDFSQVDSVRLTVESNFGRPVTVQIKDFNLAPAQEEARAVIIFDDGWTSVWEAAEIMHRYGFKGNVPIITGHVGRDAYLSLDQLKTLQNEYGWNIVNHTHSHKNATLEYVYTNTLDEYEGDVTDALQYLIRNDINSAPNWFVYPHGKTDQRTKAIIDKYYKFGRGTMDGPETFPFAEPLEVKVISVYSDTATNQEIFDAITDAKRYNHTTMLMFHKFSTERPTLFTEWQFSEFEAILRHMRDQGVRVVTLSELDRENGVPQTEFVLNEFEPSQFNLSVAVESKRSWLYALNPIPHILKLVQ